MSGRHDALYSRARGVLNQNIKRLWFKVNPYLEKKDTLDALPESPTKFIQPLQSTVISESFMDPDSRQHKKLEIDGFWEFLYSNEWSGHCSVRVMEGQLLENIVSTLHVLEKDGEVIHKKTHAYARNERERRGCYRLANQNGCETIQEILLLEFTYYGRRKPQSRGNASSSSGYPNSSLTTESYSGTDTYVLPSKLVDDSPKPKNKKIIQKRRKRESAPDFRQTIPKMNFRRFSRDPFESGANEDDTYQFPSSNFRTSQQSNISSESSDYRTTTSVVRNLSRLPCTERTGYDDVIIEGYVPPVQTDSTELFWQEKMYLGDDIPAKTEDSVLTKLRKNMKAKHEAKKEMEQFYEEWKTRRISAFKPVSKHTELETDSPSFSSTVHYRFLDSVPEFEDFLHILEEDQKFDPRFKRAKQISRKLAKRYNIARENISGMSGFEVERKKSHNISSKLHPIAEKGSNRKKSFRASDLRLHALMKTPTGSRRISSVSRNSNISESGESKQDIEKTAMEVGGVTDSKSCEKHVIEHGRRRSSGMRASISKPPKDDAPKKPKKKTEVIPSIYLTSPVGANFILFQPEAKRRHTIAVMRGSSTIAEAELEQDQVQSEEEPNEKDSSGEEPEEPTKSLFDSRKLNTKYSFERLRGKSFHKKKPAFFNVLKKYYRMQKAADAFVENSTVRGMKTKHKSVFQRLMNKDDSDFVIEHDIIGKMKTYNFLYHRRRTRASVEPCDFSSLSMIEFRDNLLRALDDFVVRKERVVSNIGAKTSTHVTFTRKSVFRHRE